MKKLLIVESPAKIKTISKFLGKDFKIMSTVGHIKDLPQKELGVSIRSRWGKKWCLAGLCPFHADRVAGSFYVNIDSGAYKCHACGAGGGDFISFLQKKHGYSFVEAIKLLNDNGGLDE